MARKHCWKSSQNDSICTTTYIESDTDSYKHKLSIKKKKKQTHPTLHSKINKISLNKLVLYQ